MRQQGYSYCIVLARQVICMNTILGTEISVTTVCVTVLNITIAYMIDAGTMPEGF
jgi:hypothetical protein